MVRNEPPCRYDEGTESSESSEYAYREQDEHHATTDPRTVRLHTPQFRRGRRKVKVAVRAFLTLWRCERTSLCSGRGRGEPCAATHGSPFAFLNARGDCGRHEFGD
jgi:hypothetical protein